jgi:predicted PurR-regulated permease PerM
MGRRSWLSQKDEIVEYVSESSGEKEKRTASPAWGSSVKLVIGASFAIIIAGLMIAFHNIIGPLLLAFVLVYMFYPLANSLHKKFNIPWRLAVVLVYLGILIVLAGLLAWGGLAIFEQSQSLFHFLEKQVETLPDVLSDLGSEDYSIGPFALDFQQFDEQAEQLLKDAVNSLTSLISSAGTLAGTIAAGAANLIAKAVLVLLVSFFILAESNGVASQIVDLNIPRYQSDILRMGKELTIIWNAFLRGQLTVILTTIVLYTIVLSILGMPYAFGLAVVAGLAHFLPYIGPSILWVLLFLVSIFQTTPAWGLTPVVYTVIVLAIGMTLDVMVDQLVTPKLMGHALHIHPAALVVGYLVGASLLGFIGVMLAAPVLATVKLFAGYALRKTFDLDPWPEQVEVHQDDRVQTEKLQAGFAQIREQVKNFFDRKDHHV